MKKLFIILLVLNFGFYSLFSDDNVDLVFESKLSEIELNQCEEGIVYYLRKLQCRGFTNEEILKSFDKLIEIYDDTELKTNRSCEKILEFLDKNIVDIFLFGVFCVLCIGGFTILAYDIQSRSEARPRVRRRTNQINSPVGGSVRCWAQFANGYHPTAEEQQDVDQLVVDLEQSFLRSNYNQNSRRNLFRRFRNDHPRDQTGWIQLVQHSRNNNILRSAAGRILETNLTEGTTEIRF